MSKKKNTLKDLDAFLKQQAAVLVAPEKLSENPQEQTNTAEISALEKLTAQFEVSTDKILDDLKALRQQNPTTFRNNLYDLILKSLDQSHISSEDKMMINTALYLKHGRDWKEAIRSYWHSKSM